MPILVLAPILSIFGAFSVLWNAAAPADPTIPGQDAFTDTPATMWVSWAGAGVSLAAAAAGLALTTKANERNHALFFATCLGLGVGAILSALSLALTLPALLTLLAATSAVLGTARRDLLAGDFVSKIHLRVSVALYLALVILYAVGLAIWGISVPWRILSYLVVALPTAQILILAVLALHFITRRT